VTAPDPLVKVAAAVLADIDCLGEQLVQHIAETLPELADDPRLRDLLAHTVTDNLVSALHVFTDGSRDVPVGAPPVALEFARRLAQHGVPITLMLRAYRLRQARFQQEMITRIGGERPDVDEVVAASRELSAVAFTFIDRISEEVVVAYQHERDTWLRQRNAVRLAKVLDVLAGKLTTCTRSKRRSASG